MLASEEKIWGSRCGVTRETHALEKMRIAA